MIVGVVRNPSKQATVLGGRAGRAAHRTLRWNPTTRGGLVRRTARRLCADRQEVDVIVKGLRAVADFEYEQQMAQMNQRLSGIDTMFMATSPEFGYLSSSLVKEVAKLGGEVKDMLPTNVYHALKERI